jgi:hypothetical protein
VGRCGELLAASRASSQCALVDADFSRRNVPTAAAVLPALVLAADNRGDASLRVVRRTAPPSKPLGCSMRELSEFTARADKQGKVLFVNFGFLTEAQLRFRPILDALSDSSLFEKTAELQGFDPVNDRYVYRYRPGSAVDRNLVEEFEPDPKRGNDRESL